MEGLTIGGAATEVPQAATRAVVRSISGLLIISALVSVLTYL
jgi:ABC-type transporter Mla maintaining outer membrane lipid asymmetry permease subunit MlaE